MLMRTWDYRGVPIEPVLTLLQQIFYSKNEHFFQKYDFFWLCDKSADSADINLGELAGASQLRAKPPAMQEHSVLFQLFKIVSLSKSILEK